MSWLARYRDLLLPIGIIACLVVILVPLPTILMDLFLAANITISVIVLVTTIYVATPLEFSIFPSLLLATTLARLVLNVATTRLILSGADSSGMDAAGGVIRSFGEFVAGDNLIVGLIIFGIIVVIQFTVITKGATRISEVAARFALDGMPGRQMAIDADMNAGAIDETEARLRREELSSQADFYGAMDGASKFVRGDAVAGLIITVINVLGGFYVGVAQLGMPLGDAAERFTKLTIGDGLVSQIPALLISLAAALLVTRSARKANLPEQFLQQLFGNPKALAVAGVFLGLMILTNLPALPLATLGAGCIGLAVVVGRESSRRTNEESERAAVAQAAKQAQREKRAEDYLTVDPMELLIGTGLLSLADPGQGGDLMERISSVRNAIAADIGIVLPKVRVRDESRLGELEYEIRLAGNPVARASVRPDRMLAIGNAKTTGTIEGEPTLDPAYGEPAVWIEPNEREQAAIYGYRVVDPGRVVATHLQAVAKRHADELLDRDATKSLVDELRQLAPAVVDELIPTTMKLSDVQQVLRLLLREEVPIRQLGIILEVLGENTGATTDPVWLAERVRQRLARTICTRQRDKEGRMHVVVLDPAIESRIAAAIEPADAGGVEVRLDPHSIDFTCDQIQKAVKKLIMDGHPPVLLVHPRIRPAVRQLTLASIPRLNVLSYSELTPDTLIESHVVISDGPAFDPEPRRS